MPSSIFVSSAVAWHIALPSATACSSSVALAELYKLRRSVGSKQLDKPTVLPC